jgi:hypothetical protein
MIRVETAKTLLASNAKALDEAYNEWYIDLMKKREEVPMLKGKAPNVLDRMFSQVPKGKGVQLGLVVIYEDFVFQPHEVGPDRGGKVDQEGGVSAVKRRMR